MVIQWDEKTLGTGVPKIDEQHRSLINTLSKIVDASKKPNAKQEITTFFQFLGNYAKVHFGFEEGVMGKHKCPSAERNKVAHAKFLDEFTKLVARFEKEGPTDAFMADLERDVVLWLLNHIKGCDAQLKNCSASTAVELQISK